MTIPAPAKELTSVERDTVEAYLVAGGVKGAAERLRVPEGTIRSRLHTARRRTKLPTVGHLLYWLDRT